MLGDGANDRLALRRAQTGIAVSTASDVAKAAARCFGPSHDLDQGQSAPRKIETCAGSIL
jgi:cation transport ATPase